MYKILCLTDHSKHSDQNSVYALLKGMLVHPETSIIDVASRGSLENKAFFNQLDLSTIYGRQVDLNFQYDPTCNFWNSGLIPLEVEKYDIIFFRLPSPLSEDLYRAIAALYKHKILINDPIGMIACSKKSILTQFEEFCPPLRVCYTIEDIKSFCEKHETIVLKPMRGYGGNGIMRVEANTFKSNKQSISKLMDANEEGVLAMKFLKNVVKGDKRLIVVGGEIVASSLRIPASGSWICNVAMGGSSAYAQPTAKEQEMVSHLAPFLLEQGILIAGIDTLEDDDEVRVLSEINVLSIGGFPQAEQQTGKPIILNTLNKIFEYAKSYANG